MARERVHLTCDILILITGDRIFLLKRCLVSPSDESMSGFCLTARYVMLRELHQNEKKYPFQNWLFSTIYYIFPSFQNPGAPMPKWRPSCTAAPGKCPPPRSTGSSATRGRCWREAASSTATDGGGTIRHRGVWVSRAFFPIS